MVVLSSHTNLISCVCHGQDLPFAAPVGAICLWQIPLHGRTATLPTLLHSSLGDTSAAESGLHRLWPKQLIFVIQDPCGSVLALPLTMGLFIFPVISGAGELSCAGSQGSTAGDQTGKQWLFQPDILALPSIALQH